MATIPAYSFAALITAYQRFMSPHKGFCCAHRALNEGLSCSQAIKRLVLRYGVLASWPYVRARFEACHTAHQVLLAQAQETGEEDNEENEYGECPVFTKEFWKSKEASRCFNRIAPCSCIPY